MTRILSGLVFMLILSSCGAIKQATRPTAVASNNSNKEQAGELKFLTIDVPVEKAQTNPSTGPSVSSKKEVSSKNYNGYTYVSGTPAVENASSLQIKYALLLDTEVEEIRNLPLFEFIEEWYGTRYCLGGTSKKCIDCSAFVQAFFAAQYSLALPRTAREQYKNCTRISTTELRQGDLLFFNTTGGVSHVGIYLQNNKFVHAATSGGVMISDMFEAYWVKKLIGAGRYDRDMLVSDN